MVGVVVIGELEMLKLLLLLSVVPRLALRSESCSWRDATQAESLLVSSDETEDWRMGMSGRRKRKERLAYWDEIDWCVA